MRPIDTAREIDVKYLHYLHDKNVRTRFASVLSDQLEEASLTNEMQSLDQFDDYNHLVTELAEFLYALYPNFELKYHFGDPILAFPSRDAANVYELTWPSVLSVTRRYLFGPGEHLLPLTPGYKVPQYKEWSDVFKIGPLNSIPRTLTSFTTERTFEFVADIIHTYFDIQSFQQQQQPTAKQTKSSSKSKTSSKSKSSNTSRPSKLSRPRRKINKKRRNSRKSR
jgi:hypothetical protein